MPLPVCGWKGCSTQIPRGKLTRPPGCAGPGFGHGCFSCSRMRSCTSAVVETAKTALHCRSAPFQGCWKAFKGARNSCHKGNLLSLLQLLPYREVVEDKQGQTAEMGISCPMPWTAEHSAEKPQVLPHFGGKLRFVYLHKIF